MKRRDFLRTASALAAGVVAPGAIADRGKKSAIHIGARPNIVVILADDLGYGSVGCYGADRKLLRTPHIDRIAKSGCRFTDASTPSSVCTPTRYGLLTGRYPWRTALKSGVVNPNDPLLPDPDRITIADWLKERDYNTAAIGKWHLGYGKGEDGKRSDFLNWAPGPLDLGFDYHFGVPNNHGDGFNVFIENDHIYGLRSTKMQPYSKSFYGRPYNGFDAPQRENKRTMADLTDKAVEWLRSQDEATPFFLYFAAVAVHHPITPSDGMRGMSDCGPYGDFIQDLDQCTGRILETLEYRNLLDNTLILFTSDNGGDIPAQRGAARPEDQAVEMGLKINADLRGDKHTIFEGGARVPFLVSWPGKIPAGSESSAMINLLDVFATVCEITDGAMPEDKAIAPDSFSFLPALLGKENGKARPSMVTADAKGVHAVRKDGWKYIENKTPAGAWKGSPRLFNLTTDPAEHKDRHRTETQRVKQLEEELHRIRTAEYSR